MICEHGEQPESVADKVVNCIKRLDSTGSQFVSTRSAVSDTSRFEPAVYTQSLQVATEADGLLRNL